MTPILETKQLSRSYKAGGTSPAIDDVSLSIPRGSFCLIVGPNGSGKSTLLRLLGLVDYPSSGQVYWGGQDVTNLSEHRRAKLRLRQIGYIFQEPSLMPELSTLENVMLPLMMMGGGDSKYRFHALEALDQLGLKNLANMLPEKLSEGQKQQIDIARAIVCKPSLILADEPTAHLDPNASQQVMSLLRQLNQSMKTTVIVVTHNVDEAPNPSHIIVLEAGRVTTKFKH